MDRIRAYFLGGENNDAIVARYPSLFQFFAGTFNQDFMLDYKTPGDALADAIDKYHRTNMAAIETELRRFLAEPREDEELDLALWQLGSYFIPSTDGVSTRAWLEMVLGLVESAADRGDS